MGAHFEALDEGVPLVPLDPRYTQVGSNRIHVQVCKILLPNLMSDICHCNLPCIGLEKGNNPLALLYESLQSVGENQPAHGLLANFNILWCNCTRPMVYVYLALYPYCRYQYICMKMWENASHKDPSLPKLKSKSATS